MGGGGFGWQVGGLVAGVRLMWGGGGGRRAKEQSKLGVDTRVTCTHSVQSVGSAVDEHCAQSVTERSGSSASVLAVLWAKLRGGNEPKCIPMPTAGELERRIKTVECGGFDVYKYEALFVCFASVVFHMISYVPRNRRVCCIIRHARCVICIFIYMSMYIHVCIYICIHTCIYIHTYIFIYLYIYTYIYIYIYVYIHIYIHTYIYIYIYIYICINYVYVCIYIYVCLCGYVRVCVYI